MPPRPKLRPDLNETAFRVLRGATGEDPKTLPPRERTEKNPEAVKRGRQGGKKGGQVRAGSLSSARRSEIAKQAASGRWKKEP
ncbi:MAG: hypothetical protein EXR93_03210 [Gemmatimonadetes bacterium]|nr:hypothetical protein [Gemmatimonadota bacterium]